MIFILTTYRIKEPPSTNPVDCEYQDWTAWTSCSVTCGGGSKSRRKLIKTPAQNGGRQCDQRLDSNFDKVQCNTQMCPAGMKFHVIYH